MSFSNNPIGNATVVVFVSILHDVADINRCLINTNVLTILLAREWIAGKRASKFLITYIVYICIGGILKIGLRVCVKTFAANKTVI